MSLNLQSQYYSTTRDFALLENDPVDIAAIQASFNADYAAGILAGNLRRYGGDVREALSAYNAGSPTATGTRTDWGDGKPVGYADSVLRHLTQLGGAGAAPAQPAAAAATTSTTSSSAAAPATSGDVNALQTLAQQLGNAGGGFSLSLPSYQPLPKADQRDLDLAPSARSDTDDAT